MPGFAWIIIAMAVGLLLLWAWEMWRRNTRTAQSMELGVTDEDVDILRRNMPIYNRMPIDLQQQVQNLTLRFIEHKKFVPCGNLEEVTQEMKLTIAGNAAMLILNRPVRYPFRQVFSILVYPSSFFNSQEERAELMDGEAWPTGSVVVAWDSARKSAQDLRDGKNLIVHEFAHQLDLENGPADGLPEIDSVQVSTWARVLSKEFAKLRASANQGKRTLLDQYGAEDPAEFFAIVTEAFFERSDRLKNQHPELYDQLRHFYRVDPACWVDP